MTQPARAAPTFAPIRRPRNAAATRAAIVEAARGRFARDGYDQVSLRDVAALAGIDPALVIRYFGSKEGLFVAVLEACAEEPDDADGGLGDFGRQLANLGLKLEGGPYERKLQAVEMAIRSTTSPVAHGIVREDIERRFVAPLAARLGGGHDAEVRAQVCIAVLMGMAVMRGVLGKTLKTQAEIDEMAAYFAPMLQQLAQPK